MDNNQNFDWKVEQFDQPAEEIKPEPPKAVPADNGVNYGDLWDVFRKNR